MMTRHTIKFQFGDYQHMRQAIDALYVVLEPARMDEGCLDCQLAMDLESEYALFFSMLWADQDRLERFLKTPAYGLTKDILRVSTKHPSIRNEVIVSTSPKEHER